MLKCQKKILKLTQLNSGPNPLLFGYILPGQFHYTLLVKNEVPKAWTMIIPTMQRVFSPQTTQQRSIIYPRSHFQVLKTDGFMLESE